MGSKDWRQDRSATKHKLTYCAAALATTLLYSVAAMAQTPMNCADPVAQDPTKVFRSGLWKQWIYWTLPGPKAFAAVTRIVNQVNTARAAAALPLLVPDPTNPVIVSVFDERNARGANGSGTFPMTSNQEAFLATFVDDTAGGSEVLFLTDPIRSNGLLASAKGVPGTPATVEREIEISSTDEGLEKVDTEWEFNTASGDAVFFKAQYLSSAVYAHSFTPAARVDYANCNLVHSTDIIYRSTPALIYRLFAREESNWVDLTAPAPDVEVRVRVRNHDSDINAIFNDPTNQPQLLIGLDRDIRIQRP